MVAWYASQPDPVVITPDGEMWAVNEGFTAFDVVQAWHTEHGNYAGMRACTRSSYKRMAAELGVNAGRRS